MMLSLTEIVVVFIFSIRIETKLGGQGRIRTTEVQAQEIYSLSSLTTWVPAQITFKTINITSRKIWAVLVSLIF